MEEIMMMMKKQPLPCLSSHQQAATTSPLSIHRNSQTISKVKPKIRIIHIFAPEIIKTDVANFRELVQRLTGKPTTAHHHRHQKGSNINKIKKPRNQHQQRRSTNTIIHEKQELGGRNSHQWPRYPVNSTSNMRSGFGDNVGLREKTMKEEKEEEEERAMWNGANTGGYLGGFTDLDGLMEELGGEFPLLPMEANHMKGFGEINLTE